MGGEKELREKKKEGGVIRDFISGELVCFEALKRDLKGRLGSLNKHKKRHEAKKMPRRHKNA